MRLKKHLHENKINVPIENFRELYGSVFTNGVLDPNKILRYAPYVKEDESEIRKSVHKLYNEPSDITLHDLQNKLEKYGEVHKDINMNRIAYSVVFETDEQLENIKQIIKDHDLYLMRVLESAGQVDIKVWENMLLDDFMSLLLKEEYTNHTSKEPIVVGGAKQLTDFIEYLQNNKSREVKAIRQ